LNLSDAKQYAAARTTLDEMRLFDPAHAAELRRMIDENEQLDKRR